MSNVYRLRPDNLPNDSTVKCMARLHELAKQGKVRGVGFVAYVDDNDFIANSCGEAFADPNNTTGMLFALARKLALRIDIGGGNL